MVPEVAAAAVEEALAEDAAAAVEEALAEDAAAAERGADVETILDVYV